MGVIASGLYVKPFSDADRSYMERGFLIQFEQIGIIHYDDQPERDVILIGRQGEDTDGFRPFGQG